MIIRMSAQELSPFFLIVLFKKILLIKGHANPYNKEITLEQASMGVNKNNFKEIN